MSWVMSSSVRSSIAKAAVAGALLVMPALSVPALTHAAPAPPDDPDCVADPAHPRCDSTLPTSPNDPRCARMRWLPICANGPWGDDVPLGPSDPDCLGNIDPLC